jgi:hypothetical protein
MSVGVTLKVNQGLSLPQFLCQYSVSCLRYVIVEYIRCEVQTGQQFFHLISLAGKIFPVGTSGRPCTYLTGRRSFE